MDLHVNYLAVVACMVSNVALGFLWYGPLFGKMWMGFMGWDPAKIDKIKMQVNMGLNYGLTSLGALVMAFALAVLIVRIPVVTAIGAVKMAGLVWLGCVAPVMMGSVLWEGKPWGLYVLNTGYQLVAMMVMANILVLWP